MTAEREEALKQFFDHQRGLERSPGDAVALATEPLLILAEELEIAGELGDAADMGARGDREGSIHEAAIALGRACIDALYGLFLSGAVETPRLREAALQDHAPPLDDAWQSAHNPFIELAHIAMAQRKQLEQLRDQPNQLYRRLYDSVALAADIAAWTAWTQLGPPNPR